MNKYEIMLIVDPAIDMLMATEIVESVFGKKNVSKVEKLENSTLAYPINKSLKAQYIVYNLESKSELIAEFTRKANIAKFIWRQMVINLDTEKGLQKSKKAFRQRISRDAKNSVKSASTKQLVENLEKVISPKTKTTKKPYTKKATDNTSKKAE
ncbi:30S ribosomal protein S6 [Mycoplasmopsis primatum]|uniref:30S ribosomal protein S6 n=1 Tax=Mycoplasmopsis primatum TaxID=55604 RepID=UPI0004984229|nr:30S ribosomal protein S6 [Mycoplasmopsis primatum]